MSALTLSMIAKLEAGQAKTELRALQGEVTKTSAAAKGLATDAKTAGASIDGLGDQSGTAASQLKVLADAELAAARAAGSLRSGLAQVQSGGFLAGNSARLFSQQLSQVGQQTMATGQFVNALAIQLPDIGIGFGALGGAVGLLAGIALPLLVNAFSGTETNALSAKDAVDEFTGSLTTYQSFVQLSATSTVELTEKFGDFAGEVRGFAEYMQGVSLGQALTDMDAAIDPLKGRLADVVSTLAQIQQLKDLVGKQQIAVDQGMLEASSLNVTKNALDALQRDIENTATSMGLLPDQVVALASAIDQLGAASGIAQIRDEAAEALALIQGWYPAGAALPPELATTASYLNEIVAKSAETTTELDGAAKGAIVLAASAPGGDWMNAAIGGVKALIGVLGAAIDANSRLSAIRNFNRDAQTGSDVYSGRGGDPRDFMPGGNKTGGAFVYNGPALDRNNNPLSTGGTGGGASAAKAEKDAVAELITKLQEEQEVLRITDPLKAEMLKYRKQLAEATAAERGQIEQLITARMREEAQLKANKDLTDLLNSSTADLLDGLIVKGMKAGDVMRSLLSSLLSSGIQAFTKGTGPLAGILGIQGGLFGGGIARKADGGLITGAGGPRADLVPIMASAGEFMMTGDATRRYRPVLERMNAGGVPGFARGGMIGAGRSAGGGGFSGGGRGGDTIIHNHLYSATGNTEIADMVARGVSLGITANNREVIPLIVKKTVRNPRESGR